MGAAQSEEAPAPWDLQVVDLPEEARPALKPACLKLSESAAAFLQPHPAFRASDDFDAASYFHFGESALRHDARLSLWLPKLVPKRVSEEAFWSNYFSHVVAILNAAAGETESFNGPSSSQAAQSPVVNGVDGTSDSAVDAQSSDADDAAVHHPQPPAKPTRGWVDQSDRIFQKFVHPHSNIDLSEANKKKDFGLPIRWGIVGCGSVVRHKSGPALFNCRGSSVVAVCSQSQESAEQWRTEHCPAGAQIQVYTSVAELVNDANVEAVYIATPPGSHAEIARLVCEACKPVLVEKPMARNYDEAKRMVDDFYRANRGLFVAFYRRELAKFVRARDVVQRCLGQVTQITYRYQGSHHHPDNKTELGWRVDAQQSGGGIFMDLAPHVLDIVDFLVGPLSHVYGDALHSPLADEHADRPATRVETAIAVSARTQQHGLVSMSWNFTANPALYEDCLEVHGQYGKLSFSVFGSDAPVLTQFNPQSGGVESRKTSVPKQPEAVHTDLVQTICNTLRGVPQAVVASTGDSSLRTQRILDIVLRKFYRARDDDFWTRPATWDCPAPQRSPR